jgi:uncharacterized protein
MNPVPTPEEAVAATRAWLEAKVIGLNLCPFARAVHDAGRIRYVASGATTPDALRAELSAELRLLETLEPATTDTTLLIHAHVLGDFLDFNDFLDVADEEIDLLGYSGTFQIASFHPRYQFAGVEPDDVGNRTNRSPYPMLQILREASVTAALESYPDADRISERNIETLRRLSEQDGS